MACNSKGIFQHPLKKQAVANLLNLISTEWVCEFNKLITSITSMYQGFHTPYENGNFIYPIQQFQPVQQYSPMLNMPNFNYNSPMQNVMYPIHHIRGGFNQRFRQQRRQHGQGHIPQDFGNFEQPFGNDNRFSSQRKRKYVDNDNTNANETKKLREDYVLKIPPTPKSSSNAEITQAMIEYFIKSHQTEEMYIKKVKLRDALYKILNGVLPYSGLYIVGSSMSGCGTMTSDMDLCLMLTETEIEQAKEAPDLLYLIQRALSKCSFIHSTQVIRAKVPILRFTDNISKVECDLNVNNSVGIRNTHLVKYYCMLDWRVRPLMLYIKMWSRFHDINDARKMTISSYSLCLMVIHYLQFAVSPPVLPSLQKMSPEIFHSKSDIRALRFDYDLKYKSENEDTLGDLFLGFLEYYTNKFDFMNNVISVRTGTRMQKYISMGQVDDSKQWKFINIEEPFDLTNTSRSVYDQNTFQRIQRVFRSSHRKLSQTRDVKSVLSSPF